MKMAPQEIRTFFVTTNAWAGRSLFQTERMADLLIDVLQTNRRKGHLQLHEFVIMPNHLHLLLTPAFEIPLERAVQFIKGGFSYRAKRELGFNGVIWQTSFTEHGIKDAQDYLWHRECIFSNPQRAGLREAYPYCSSTGRHELDEAPPALKRPSGATQGSRA